MKFYFEKEFWSKEFITFENYQWNTNDKNNKQIKLILYENSFFYGTVINEIKEGIGIIYYSTGELLFGQFYNDKLHGKANIIFPDGTFLRTMYKNNQQIKSSLLIYNEMYVLLNIEEDLIKGYCTKINTKKNIIKKYLYSNNKKNKEKIEPTSIKNHTMKNIIRNKLLKNVNKYSNTDTNYNLEIGSFNISNQEYYIGTMVNNEMSGIGIHIDFNRKELKYGFFKNNTFNTFGTKILFDGNILTGYIKENNFEKNVLKYNKNLNLLKRYEFENNKIKYLIKEEKNFNIEIINEFCKKFFENNQINYHLSWKINLIKDVVYNNYFKVEENNNNFEIKNSIISFNNRNNNKDELLESNLVIKEMSNPIKNNKKINLIQNLNFKFNELDLKFTSNKNFKVKFNKSILNIEKNEIKSQRIRKNRYYKNNFIHKNLCSNYKKKDKIDKNEKLKDHYNIYLKNFIDQKDKNKFLNKSIF